MENTSTPTNLPQKQCKSLTIRETDRQVAFKVLTTLIAGAAAKISVQYNMSKEQVAICAQEIYTDLPELRLEDVEKVLRKGCQGEYGELYNRFDQTIIFGWIQKFYTEKSMSRTLSKPDQD